VKPKIPSVVHRLVHGYICCQLILQFHEHIATIGRICLDMVYDTSVMVQSDMLWTTGSSGTSAVSFSVWHFNFRLVI
jgi:hypothetical protein